MLRSVRNDVTLLVFIFKLNKAAKTTLPLPHLNLMSSEDTKLNDVSLTPPTRAQVMFSVFFNKRLKTLMATKVSLIDSSTIATQAAVLIQKLTAPRSPSPPHPVDTTVEVSLSSSPPPSPAAAAAPPLKVIADRPATPPGSAKKIRPSSPAAAAAAVAASTKTTTAKQAPLQYYQGYVAALKESFGFVETVDHDKEIFFHFRYNNDYTIQIIIIGRLFVIIYT